MLVSASWWDKPMKLTITVNEYQIYDITKLNQKEAFKRRFLCCSTYDFYTDEDQDCIEKCLLTITDNFGVVCIQKVYNRIDFENRKYNTNK